MRQLTLHATGGAVTTAGRQPPRNRGKAAPLWTFVVAALALAPLGTAGLLLAALVAVGAPVAVAAVDARVPALST